jgi:hypothetical protein
MEQLRWLHLDPAERRGAARFETLALDLRLKEATDLARRLQDLSVVTVRDASEKQRLHDELRSKLADLAIVADTVVGAAVSTAGARGVSAEQRLDSQLGRVRTALDEGRPEVERTAALNVLHGVSIGWLRTDLPDEPPAPWDRQCLHWPLAFPEVFLSGEPRGFDAVVGNPPFLGGTKISESLGQGYRQHLSQAIARRPTNRADLVAFFLLRAAEIGRRFGLLATNTVSQGDTREIGLAVLIDEYHWVITHAVKSSPWPGDATIEIAKLWMQADPWRQLKSLDGELTDGIDSLLQRARRTEGTPHRLANNLGRCFLGDQLNSMGFVLTSNEADRLLKSDSSNEEIIRPYLSGEDLNSSPTQAAARWVINFRDWPLERAEHYPLALSVLEERARPDIERKSSKNYKGWSDRWWQFWMYKSALHQTVDGLPRVVAMAKVSKTVAAVLVETVAVFTDKVVVFAFDDEASFGVIASTFHYWWALTYASTMRNDLSYNPTDCFETYPMPLPTTALHQAGSALHTYRSSLMQAGGWGLTKTYNRVHDVDEKHPDIVRLRELHVELDYAVRDAYGWADLNLDHHHWETPQGMRFTVSPAAKGELSDRLLELNHAQYAAEVAAGMHDKRGKKAPVKRGAKARPLGQETML